MRTNGRTNIAYHYAIIMQLGQTHVTRARQNLASFQLVTQFLCEKRHCQSKKFPPTKQKLVMERGVAIVGEARSDYSQSQYA